jgi:hypothetical protein
LLARSPAASNKPPKKVASPYAKITKTVCVARLEVLEAEEAERKAKNKAKNKKVNAKKAIKKAIRIADEKARKANLAAAPAGAAPVAPAGAAPGGGPE